MMRFATFICLGLLPVACGFHVAHDQPQFPGLHPLTGVAFGDSSGTAVIFLHGDVSSIGPADYLYDYALNMAQEHKVVAIALLRPGYWDSDGRRSFGSHNARHDHYTARNNELLAKTIANLKKENGFSRVVAVGHSGGAAQIGAVIGQYPGLVDVAILAACPCDIKRWRKDRGSEWPNSEPQSPSNFVEKVDRSTTVTALTGTNDIVTKAYLANEYVDSLRNVGINANFLSVPGGEHKFSTIADAVVQQIEFHLGED